LAKPSGLAWAQVTVFSLVYNHEKFIHQACESFLNQKTYFHDDASTDNNQRIIHAYKKQFPKIFKIKFRKRNIFSSGKQEVFLKEAASLGTNFIAFCEGDDYFTRIHKIQTQLNFLKRNNQYSGCFHNSIRVDDKSNILDQNYCKMKNGAVIDEKMLIGALK